MSRDLYVVIEHFRGQIADISKTMLVAAREMANGTGGKVVAVLLGHQVEALSAELAADQVLYAEHSALAEFNPTAYLKVLTAVISESSPRAVLLGDTSIGGDLGGWLAHRLSLPLVSHCLKVRVEEGEIFYTAQICGGKILAEGILPAPTAIAMFVPGGYKLPVGQSINPPPIVRLEVLSLEELPVSLIDFIEPAGTDIDISKEAVLVSVGRGIQNEDNIQLAEELALALGGAVCASRPVVDQGWLPTTRLVGKSGKKVKPKLYLALGISGAPEHTESITDSEMIIAINTDPKAPIFNLARYGITLSIFDVVEALTEKIKQTKG